MEEELKPKTFRYEVHGAQEEISFEDIKAGMILRSLKAIIHEAWDDDDEYEYGIVVLEKDSNRRIRYSYNYIKKNGWAEGGVISDKDTFILPREEIKDMVLDHTLAEGFQKLCNEQNERLEHLGEKLIDQKVEYDRLMGQYKALLAQMAEGGFWKRLWCKIKKTIPVIML